MKFEEFKKSLEDAYPQSDWPIQLTALWFEAKGQWKTGHDLIDHLEDPISAHVHAYFHRVEGDLWNARYWYRRAKQVECQESLSEEWEKLVRSLLN